MTYCMNVFPGEYLPQVFDNLNKIDTFEWKHQSKQVQINLSDTAGSDDYTRLRGFSYTNADIFLICFDISNPSSFVNIESKWIPELIFWVLHHPGMNNKVNPLAILVGLKSDLVHENVNHELLVYGYIRKFKFRKKCDIFIPNDIMETILLYARYNGIMNGENKSHRDLYGKRKDECVSMRDIKGLLKRNKESKRKTIEIREYVEVSSLEDYNVNQVFQVALKAVFEYNVDKRSSRKSKHCIIF